MCSKSEKTDFMWPKSRAADRMKERERGRKIEREWLCVSGAKSKRGERFFGVEKAWEWMFFLCESMNVCHFVRIVPNNNGVHPLWIHSMPIHSICSPLVVAVRCALRHSAEPWSVSASVLECRSLIDYIDVMAVGEIAWSVTVLNADFEMAVTIYIPLKLE